MPVSSLSDVKAVSAGSFHSLALLENGTVMAWGGNGSGRLGDGMTDEEQSESTTPVAVKVLTGVAAISAGDTHSLALLENGTVMAWGFNWMGVLGNGMQGDSQELPAPVPELTEVAGIAAGESHDVAFFGPR